MTNQTLKRWEKRLNEELIMDEGFIWINFSNSWNPMCEINEASHYLMERYYRKNGILTKKMAKNIIKDIKQHIQYHDQHGIHYQSEYNALIISLKRLRMAMKQGGTIQICTHQYLGAPQWRTWTI